MIVEQKYLSTAPYAMFFRTNWRLTLKRILWVLVSLSVILVTFEIVPRNSGFYAVLFGRYLIPASVGNFCVFLFVKKISIAAGAANLEIKEGYNTP